MESAQGRVRSPDLSTINEINAASHLHQGPGHGCGFLVERHPCPAWRGTLPRAAEGARIQHACQAEIFIAGDVSVSVKQKIGSPHARRRNMHQEERLAQALEKETPGQIETPVVVAKHSKEWPAEGLNGFQRRLVAEVPQMPDLVGPLQFSDDGDRESPVGIGDYGDAHHEISVYSLAA